MKAGTARLGVHLDQSNEKSDSVAWVSLMSKTATELVMDGPNMPNPVYPDPSVRKTEGVGLVRRQRRGTVRPSASEVNTRVLQEQLEPLTTRQGRKDEAWKELSGRGACKRC